MTFDQAQELFRSDPCRKTAFLYHQTAMIYWADEMIGDKTFAAAASEVAVWLKDGKPVAWRYWKNNPPEQVPPLDEGEWRYLSPEQYADWGKDINGIEPLYSNDRESSLLKVIRLIKLRLHFLGWPAEAMWNVGTEEKPRWIADWRYEINLIENALHGTEITQPMHPNDTRRANEVKGGGDGAA